MDMADYIDIAILAAKEAGRIHQKYFNTDFQIKTKGHPFDLVTAVDLEAEEKIVSTIRKFYPSHNFLAEEQNYGRTDSAYTWIIDPLDGTNNFSYGLPVFCVSIALAKEGCPVVGVVYNVIRDELFYAEKDKGAFLNGRKIVVSPVENLNESLLITGFYYDRGAEMIENLEKVKQFFLQKIIGIRRFGSAALDLCYIACGRATGFWEFELNPWDFAAGKLITEEAGGVVTGRYGESVRLVRSFIVASNGKIHDKMLAILRERRSCEFK